MPSSDLEELFKAPYKLVSSRQWVTKQQGMDWKMQYKDVSALKVSTVLSLLQMVMHKHQEERDGKRRMPGRALALF